MKVVQRGLRKMPAVLAAFGLAAALVLTGCPSEVTPDVGWSAVADCDDNTTAIVFNFNAAVGLYQDDISIVSPGNAVVPLGLTGGGRMWTLAVASAADGEVWVSINRGGISGRSVPVTVGRDDTGIGFTTNWVAAQSAIQLTFDDPISELNFTANGENGGTVSDVHIINATGAATVTGISGTGDTWWVSVDVERPGDVYVVVSRPGIQLSPESVTLSLNALTDINFDLATSILSLTFSNPVFELVAADIAVTDVVGSATLANPRMTDDLDGINWDLDVTILREGSVQFEADFARTGITTTATTILTLGLIALDEVVYTTDNPLAERALVLTFTHPVFGLTAEQVNVAVTPGTVTIGTPVASDYDGGDLDGTQWTVPIVSFTGSVDDMTVSINRAGISDAAEVVTDASDLDVAELSNASIDNNTRLLTLTFDTPVLSLAQGQIGIALISGTNVTVGSAPSSVYPYTIWNVPMNVTGSGSGIVWVNRADVDRTPVNISWGIPGFSIESYSFTGGLAGRFIIESDVPLTTVPSISVHNSASNYITVTVTATNGFGTRWVVDVSSTFNTALPEAYRPAPGASFTQTIWFTVNNHPVSISQVFNGNWPSP